MKSFFATCGVVLCLPAKSEAQAIRVGQPYPDFALPTIADGKALSLSQFRGKKVLLIQFASW